MHALLSASFGETAVIAMEKDVFYGLLLVLQRSSFSQAVAALTCSDGSGKYLNNYSFSFSCNSFDKLQIITE